jgi:opine dehydrogenase
MTSIAVLGAGSGGQTFSACLKSQGHYVSLWNRSIDVINSIKKNRGISLSGVITTSSLPDRLTIDITKSIEGAEFIFVVVPASAHKEIARSLAPIISSEQTVILNPGRTAGAFEFKKILRENGCTGKLPLIFETQSLLFTCRMNSPGQVNIYAIKQNNCLATFKNIDVPPSILSKLNKFYPGLKIAPSTLNTSLDNIGAILHPAPVLLNTGWIENRQSFFAHYYGGISKSIASFLEKLDQERIKIADAYGIKIASVKEWHELIYGSAGKDLYETLQNNSKYASIDAPYTLKSRYITEDIPTGLVPLSELGKIVNIPTPNIDLVVELAHALTNINFRHTGRNIQNLGLMNKNKNDVIDMF